MAAAKEEKSVLDGISVEDLRKELEKREPVKRPPNVALSVGTLSGNAVTDDEELWFEVTGLKCSKVFDGTDQSQVNELRRRPSMGDKMYPQYRKVADGNSDDPKEIELCERLNIGPGEQLYGCDPAEYKRWTALRDKDRNPPARIPVDGLDPTDHEAERTMAAQVPQMVAQAAARSQDR